MSEQDKTQEQTRKTADIDNLEVTELDDEDMEDVSGGLDNSGCNFNNNKT